MSQNNKISRIRWIFGILLYLQPIITCNGVNKRLNFHLKLYHKHCGHVPSCANTTDDDQREDYAMPIPCCPPCSCSPTCGIRGNCCPGYEEVPVASQNASSVDRNINGNQVVNRTDSQIELTTQNQSRETTELNNFIERMENLTVCIRPQVLYGPNRYIDSEAYLMIAKCIATVGNASTETVRDCLDEKTTFYDELPVTSSLTGLTYVNTFCLLCNEGDSVNSSVFNEWDVKLVHYATHYNFNFVFQPYRIIIKDILESVSRGYSNIHYVPRLESQVQKCDTYDVSSCNQTGLWENYDKRIENVCHNGHILPVLDRLPDNHGSLNIVRFKNVACIHCNAGSNFNEGSSFCGFNSASQKHSYSLTLNMKYTDGYNAIRESFEDLEDAYTYGTVLDMPKSNVCPLGYLALMGRCRRLMCPRDHYISNTKCVPLYKTIKGLKLNLKIDLHIHITQAEVKFTNPMVTLEQFLNVVNASLSKYVTFKHRDISVWYGPKRGKLSDMYYLFDIYLFNTSDTIEYQAVVSEIRTFYNNLQKYRTIVLSNGARKGIEIRFNHRLNYQRETYKDISGGELRILSGDPLSASIHIPAVMISDVNWCHRVVFKMTDEVEPIGKGAYSIKYTDINVFQDQYDILGSRDDAFMYLCKDLFIGYIDGENVAPEITVNNNIKPYYEDINDNPVEDINISVTIVAVLVGLLVLATFCKLHNIAQKIGQSKEQDINVDAEVDVDVGMSEDVEPDIEMISLGPARNQNVPSTIAEINHESSRNP